MPCKLFLTGDPEPVWLNDPADVVLTRIADAVVQAEAESAAVFVRLDMAPLVPLALGGPHRAAYVQASAVQAILSFHPGEYEHALNDAPDWAIE